MEKELDNGTLNQTDLESGAGSSTASPEKDASESQQIQTEPGAVKYGHGPGQVVPTTGEESLNKPAVETVKKDVEKEKAADDQEAAEVEAKGKGKDDERFDKHPRFVQLKTERDTLKDLVGTLTNTLKELQAGKPEKEDGGEELTFSDLTKMSKEELAERLSEDPHSILLNMYQQLKHDTALQIKQETDLGTRQSKIEQSYAKFEEDNPDFSEMWNKGEIQAYIKENPGENPKSAYFALTLEKKIAEREEKVRKETEAKILKQIKAKGGAGAIGRGPTSERTSQPQVDSRLKEAKNYGGVVSVIADHVRQLRRARGG